MTFGQILGQALLKSESPRLRAQSRIAAGNIRAEAQKTFARRRAVIEDAKKAKGEGKYKGIPLRDLIDLFQ